MEKLKLLIADDEPGMRKGAGKVLRNFSINISEDNGETGFIIHEAPDGKEVMEKLEAESFDLLLLDYKMPELSGLEVLEQIIEKKIDVLTVMVTAYASLEVAVSATKNGAFDFLAKPFSPDELKRVVTKAARHLLARRQARQLAEEKRKVRFQFISVLAHELKAPLAAVDSYLKLMDKRIAGEKIDDYDKIIKRSIIRIDGMRKMIFDLLDLTRLESGQKKRELKHCNVVEAAKMSIETMAMQAKARGIEIDLKSDEQILLTADSGELDIIFNNLISNAVKYNKDNGKVDVEIEKNNDDIIISVSDSGFGMTEEEQEQLFGEFVRIKNDNTRNILGSGLGLSILKKLVKLYDGTINVQSEKDVGSTFTVMLKDRPSEAVGEN